MLNGLQSGGVIGFRVGYGDGFANMDEKNLAREFGVSLGQTKVFIKNGKRVLKDAEAWDRERIASEINKFLE